MEEKALEEVGRGTHYSMLALFTQHEMYQLTFLVWNIDCLLFSFALFH